ncbi:hypothetical protein DLR62_06265 [Vibrio tarriae]|nr:hypothetical protein DLR62_06265 [Vibrio tarriae]
MNNAFGKRTTLNAWIEEESGWSQRFCDRQSITHSGISQAAYPNWFNSLIRWVNVHGLDIKRLLMKQTVDYFKTCRFD